MFHPYGPGTIPGPFLVSSRGDNPGVTSPMGSLRSIVRSAPPVKWLAGLFRRKQFDRRLAEAQANYDPRSGLPPPMLRFRVHGALDEDSYVGVGAAVARVIVAELESANVRLDGLHLLDFACGPGRVMTALSRITRRCRFDGCDIDAEAIDWAQRNLAEVGRFQTNDSVPPSPYRDATFDVIYTVSLFTHLDETSQLAWLGELDRVLKPGGHVLATLHGSHALSSCTAAERSSLARRGFHFRVGHKGALKLDGLPDSYQTAFHTKEYVARVWSRHFDVVSHSEGGLHGHQDVVVLRKKMPGP